MNKLAITGSRLLGGTILIIALLCSPFVYQAYGWSWGASRNQGGQNSGDNSPSRFFAPKSNVNPSRNLKGPSRGRSGDDDKSSSSPSTRRKIRYDSESASPNNFERKKSSTDRVRKTNVYKRKENSSGNYQPSLKKDQNTAVQGKTNTYQKPSLIQKSPSSAYKTQKGQPKTSGGAADNPGKRINNDFGTVLSTGKSKNLGTSKTTDRIPSGAIKKDGRPNQPNIVSDFGKRPWSKSKNADPASIGLRDKIKSISGLKPGQAGIANNLTGKQPGKSNMNPSGKSFALAHPIHGALAKYSSSSLKGPTANGTYTDPFSRNRVDKKTVSAPPDNNGTFKTKTSVKETNSKTGSIISQKNIERTLIQTGTKKDGKPIYQASQIKSNDRRNDNGKWIEKTSLSNKDPKTGRWDRQDIIRDTETGRVKQTAKTNGSFHSETGNGEKTTTIKDSSGQTVKKILSNTSFDPKSGKRETTSTVKDASEKVLNTTKTTTYFDKKTGLWSGTKEITDAAGKKTIINASGKKDEKGKVTIGKKEIKTSGDKNQKANSTSGRAPAGPSTVASGGLDQTNAAETGTSTSGTSPLPGGIPNLVNLAMAGLVDNASSSSGSFDWKNALIGILQSVLSGGVGGGADVGGGYGSGFCSAGQDGSGTNFEGEDSSDEIGVQIGDGSGMGSEEGVSGYSRPSLSSSTSMASRNPNLSASGEADADDVAVPSRNPSVVPPRSHEAPQNEETGSPNAATQSATGSCSGKNAETSLKRMLLAVNHHTISQYGINDIVDSSDMERSQNDMLALLAWRYDDLSNACSELSGKSPDELRNLLAEDAVAILLGVVAFGDAKEPTILVPLELIATLKPSTTSNHTLSARAITHQIRLPQDAVPVITAYLDQEVTEIEGKSLALSYPRNYTANSRLVQSVINMIRNNGSN